MKHEVLLELWKIYSLRLHGNQNTFSFGEVLLQKYIE